MAVPHGATTHAKRFTACVSEYRWTAWETSARSVCAGGWLCIGNHRVRVPRRAPLRLLKCCASAMSAAPGASNGHVRLAMSASPSSSATDDCAESSMSILPMLHWPPPPTTNQPKPLMRACYTADDVESTLRYVEAESATRLLTLVNCYSALAFNLADAFKGTDRHIPLALARQNVALDFSQAEALPRILSDALRIKAVRMMRRAACGNPLVESVSPDNAAAIEQQNRVWFLSHCQAVRDGSSADQVFTIDGIWEEYSGLTVLANDYADEDMYFRSLQGTSHRDWLGGVVQWWTDSQPRDVVPYELCCWALARLNQANGNTLRPVITWPSVSFQGEEVMFEWAIFSPSNGGRLSLLAYGEVLFCRAGDEGCICRKISERTTILRNIFTAGSDLH